MRDAAVGFAVGLLVVLLSACVTALRVDCSTDYFGRVTCTQSSVIDGPLNAEENSMPAL
jgi:hypothetical protein